MIVNKYIHEEIKKNLSRHGLGQTWQALLFRYVDDMVKNGRGDMVSILQDKLFGDVKKINFVENILASLSMGQIAGLYEFSLAHCDRAARKTAGQYFTPDDAAQLMADKAVKAFARPTENQEKIWCDPCAGIGNLAYYLIAQQPDAEDFLTNNIFFIDRDPLALFIARVLLTAHFQRNNKNLFYDIEKNFITADFLIAEDLPPFDYALFNPPYGKVEANSDHHQHAPDFYALFIERVMEKTRHRHGGFVAVTPQSFTHAQKFLLLRQKLLAQAKKITIYNFDNVPDGLFNSRKFGSINSNQANSTRAAITIFHHKTSVDDKIEFFITPWLRWRASERKRLLATVDDFLTPLKHITADIFPKIHNNFKDLYQQTKGEEMLASVLSPVATKYKLFVPTTPRYFISAMRRLPNRVSYRTLYFLSAATRDQAYVLLNSSFCYWWWRVNDGGMSLSQRTLLTLPWVTTDDDQSWLVKKIQWSEKNNKVIKKNAGRDNENVKHDASLLQHLNLAVVAGLRNNIVPSSRNWCGGDFLKLHANSVLA